MSDLFSSQQTHRVVVREIESLSTVNLRVKSGGGRRRVLLNLGLTDPVTLFYKHLKETIKDFGDRKGKFTVGKEK